MRDRRNRRANRASRRRRRSSSLPRPSDRSVGRLIRLRADLTPSAGERSRFSWRRARSRHPATFPTSFSLTAAGERRCRCGRCFRRQGSSSTANSSTARRDRTFTSTLRVPSSGPTGSPPCSVRTRIRWSRWPKPTAASRRRVWQRSTFPKEFQEKIEVVHEGVDLASVRPDPTARLRAARRQNPHQDRRDRDLASRNLEPVRGYHVFLRALPAILRARPKAQVVIAGGDGNSYSHAPPAGKTWKAHCLDEVVSKLDLSRVHFVGTSRPRLLFTTCFRCRPRTST